MQMEYGDLQFFDIIIFFAIAAFLVFRLRKVLGRRTGFEKDQKESFKQTKNIIREKNKKTEVPEMDIKFAELKKAYEILDGFDYKKFLEGAKIAFETIIDAFNGGDKENLKILLTNKTYAVFEKAIDEKQNDPNSQIFSLNIDKIEKVSTNNEKITIGVKFISEQFKNNDESTITKKEDIWFFEKKIKSKNPNWLLSST